MVEDIIEAYKRKCTLSGQFMLYNSFVAITIILCLGGFFGILVFVYFYGKISELLLLYASLLPIIIVEMLYIWIAKRWIFRKQKKFVVKVFKQLISNEKNEKIIARTTEKVKKIEEMPFKLKYFIHRDPIDKIFDMIKFDEFLLDLKIKDKDDMESRNAELEAYIKNMSNVNSYIKTAFWGIGGTIVFAPIVEYAQAIYIPDDSTSFIWSNVLIYLIIITPFVIVIIVSEFFLKKMNYSMNLRKKRMLIRLSDRLKNTVFGEERLKKYLETDLDTYDN